MTINRYAGVPIAVILNDRSSFSRDLINIDAEAYNGIC